MDFKTAFRLSIGVCTFMGSISTHAGNVLFLSDIEQPELVSLIEKTGHAVTASSWSQYNDVNGGPNTAVFNTYDLIVYGAIGPSHYFTKNAETWNTLTPPAILTSTWHARSSVWGWVDGTTVSRGNEPITGFMGATDPVWKGIKRPGDKKKEIPYSAECVKPDAAPVNGGKIVGSNKSVIFLARWPRGAFGAGAGEKILFPVGLASNLPEKGETGAYNLTPTGELLFQNAVVSLIGGKTTIGVKSKPGTQPSQKKSTPTPNPEPKFESEPETLGLIIS